MARRPCRLGYHPRTNGRAEVTGGLHDLYARLISRALKPCKGTTLLVEPGRSLVAEAGVLLTRVTGTKVVHGREVVILDAGMNDLIRPALYEAHHRVTEVKPKKGDEQVVVDLVGPVCESSDVVGRDRMLPPLAIGDLLAIRDAGAYGSAMSSNYNRRPLPAEVITLSPCVQLKWH